MRRTETIGFSTRTPDGFDQLLGGVRDLPATEIQGLLTLPDDKGAPTPLVIVSIGSRGLTSGREALYTDALCKRGVATLIVDSYSGRGFTETVSDQGKLSYASSAADALFALDHVGGDPRFDPQRIALLGYSRGGLVTTLSYDRRLQDAVLGGRARFCAYVALYPPCYLQWEAPTPLSAPMLAFFGGKDVQALATVGAAYMERLNQNGGRIEVIVYPEAVHSFDAATPAAPTGGLNLALAEVRVRPDGRMYEATTGLWAEAGWQPFLHELRQKIGREGSITGHGPLPRDIAVKPIVDFLGAAFARRCGE